MCPAPGLQAPYGIGISCHAKFFSVCVLMRRAGGLRTWHGRFPANRMCFAGSCLWVREKMRAVGPAPLRYTIDAAGPHVAEICAAWGGSPSLVAAPVAHRRGIMGDPTNAEVLAWDSYESAAV